MKDDFAFPRVTPLGQMAPGMELRDWFAGMVAQGYLMHDNDSGDFGPEDIADAAYFMADCLMKRRKENIR